MRGRNAIGNQEQEKLQTCKGYGQFTNTYIQMGKKWKNGMCEIIFIHALFNVLLYPSPQPPHPLWLTEGDQFNIKMKYEPPSED